MDWFDEGNQLLDKKELDESIACYQKAITNDPTNVEAWYNIAIAYMYLGEYKNCLKACEKFIESEKEDSDARNLKGFALFNLKYYEEAINTFSEATILNKEDGYAWNNKGSALCNLGLWDEAIKCFETAFSVKLKCTNALTNKTKALNYKRLEESKEKVVDVPKVQKDLLENIQDDQVRGSYSRLFGISVDLSPGDDMVCPVCGFRVKLRTKGQRCHNDGTKLITANPKK